MLRSVISCATAVYRLLCIKVVLIEHAAYLTHELQAIHVWHAVVNEQQFEHLCSALEHLCNSLLYYLNSFGTYHCGVATDAKAHKLATHAEDVHVFVVNDQGYA